MKVTFHKILFSMAVCFFCYGCAGIATTDGQNNHERFLEKTKNLLGENHRKYLDYTDALQEFQKICESQSPKTFNELGEKPIETALEEKLLRTKKELYEAVASKNKMELIPARIQLRCVLIENQPHAKIEAFYEEEGDVADQS